MRRIPPDTFDRPWLILCEGDGDRRFFNHLIGAHDIGNGQYDVHFPGKESDPSGGRGKFGIWLSLRMETSQTFRENVKAVLIISDNDDDSVASFTEIQAGLRAAGGFGVPEQEHTVVQQPGYPAIVIFMIPPGEHGNLETLCLRAAYRKWPLKEALDVYVGATPANDWRLGKQSKMRMQALLAAICKKKPDTTFSWHWQQPEEYHVPVSDPCFSDVVDFLSNFEALLAAA